MIPGEDQVQAAMLARFSSLARKAGVMFLTPDEYVSTWPVDVVNWAGGRLEGYAFMRNAFDFAERTGHLVRTDETGEAKVGHVRAWSLPNVSGRTCICGCGCSKPREANHSLCWPCFAESKDHSPSEHIAAVLRSERVVFERLENA